jgi:glycosyltransferase involved in cell wall biosynthesis
LRILVSNRCLATTGGSENFTYAIIEELVRLNYDVEYFTFLKGKDKNGVSQRIESLGVPFMQYKDYELILASGNNAVRYLAQFGFMIDTMHGVLPGAEEPSALADLYVSVSPYIRDYYLKQGFQSKVIMNGINCRRFRPLKELNKQLTNVLSLCQSDESNKFIARCCKKIGVGFRKLDKQVENKWDIEYDINDADLVIGIGRSLYDGMACGRAVISYDKRSYRDKGHEGDGYLTKDNIHKSMQRNCTGTRAFTESEFIAELKKYRPEDGNDMRKIALDELNVEKTVQEYLNYFNGCNTEFNISNKDLRQIKKKLIIAYYKDLERSIESYENSKSWKITAPLRNIMKIARKFFNMIKSLKYKKFLNDN